MLFNFSGVATEVECKLYVRSLGSINPDTMVSALHLSITLEPVIIMSPAEMTVGPNHSQIKFEPL